jgi:hypothetical protein
MSLERAENGFQAKYGFAHAVLPPCSDDISGLQLAASELNSGGASMFMVGGDSYIRLPNGDIYMSPTEARHVHYVGGQGNLLEQCAHAIQVNDLQYYHWLAVRQSAMSGHTKLSAQSLDDAGRRAGEVYARSAYAYQLQAALSRCLGISP